MEQVQEVDRKKWSEHVRAFTHKWLPGFDGSVIQLLNIGFAVVIALMLIEAYQNHWGHAVWGTVFCVVFLGIALDTDGEKQRAALMCALLILFWPLVWLVHGFADALSVLIVMIGFLAVLLFELIPANRTVLAIVQAAALIFGALLTWSVPSQRVYETAQRELFYTEVPLVLALLDGTAVRYHNPVYDGTITFTNTPENWRVTANFKLDEEHPKLMEGLRFLVDNTAWDTVKLKLEVPFPATMELDRGGDPVATVREHLEEMHPYFSYEVLPVYEYVDRQTW